MDTNKYKEKLEAEKANLVSELDAVGNRNPNDKGGWEAKPDTLGMSDSRDEVAERLEELGERQATEVTLEARLANVILALEKIEAGKFGTCEISGEQIEEDRLEINPAARTCKTHINEEDSLK